MIWNMGWICRAGTDHNSTTAQMCVLRRGAVAAEPPDSPGLARLLPIKDGHVVIAAVVISLNIKLLEPQLDDLMREWPGDEF